MRRVLSRLTILLAALVLFTRASADDKAEGFRPLFNGKNLDGFKFFLDPKMKDADPAKTWSVKEGVIVCTGKPTGFFYTTTSHTNYVLRYDWRYPEGSPPTSNSGCLVHMQPPFTKNFPQCVEPQGRYMDHGKLFFIGVPKDKIDFQKFDVEAHKKVLRPMGQWSTTEIICKADGTVVVKLNGTEVASGKTNLKEGPIGWQSEGAEIHFRNIHIKEMK